MKKDNFVYGKQVVNILLNHNPKSVLHLYARTPETWQVKVQALKLSLKVHSLTPLLLKNFSLEQINHQGIVALVADYQYFPWAKFLGEIKSKSRDLVLILDKVQDSQNFGAIIRSAVLLGVQHLIIGQRQQVPVNATVIKASVGAAYLLKITRVNNLNQSIEILKKQGYWIYSSNLNQEAQDLRQVEYAAKSVLVVGNEHSGVSALVTKNSDVNLFIPTTLRIDSLNVSTATALILFQISSQLGLI